MFAATVVDGPTTDVMRVLPSVTVIMIGETFVDASESFVFNLGSGPLLESAPARSPSLLWRVWRDSPESAPGSHGDLAATACKPCAMKRRLICKPHR